MKPLNKFQDTYITAKGEKRASIELKSLNTLWFNTGTLCNLECKNCYIESSPKNDRLSYLTLDDVEKYLIEIKKHDMGTQLIGLTGGEPFLNPSIIPITEKILSYGYGLLILTNANRIINRHKENLLRLKEQFQSKLHLRISLDHFTEQIHDQERGEGAFIRTMSQTKWLYDNGFEISIASRSLNNESQSAAFEGHKRLLQSYNINLNLEDKLVIFPEMQSGKDVPEITTSCWEILKKNPEDQMCATERMIVKRKGENLPVVMPCTLLAYDKSFILGNSLKESQTTVYLNHKFCAEFCVLGGASCSNTK